MDSVSRLGGDEFVILLPALESAGGAQAGPVAHHRAIDAPISLSHGVVTVHPASAYPFLTLTV